MPALCIMTARTRTRIHTNTGTNQTKPVERSSVKMRSQWNETLRFVIFPMHLKNGGSVTLQAVLAIFPENDLLWRILDLDGVGTAPNGMTMEAFEAVIRTPPGGYRATWGELVALSAGLEQTWDCLIVGGPPNIPIEADTVEAAGFPGCEFIIEAFDSSKWTVGTIDDGVCDLLAATD